MLLADENSTENSSPFPQSENEFELPEESQPDHATLTAAGVSGRSQDIDIWLQICVRHLFDIFQSACDHKPSNISALTEHIQQLVHLLAQDESAHNSLELEVHKVSGNIREQNEQVGDLVEKAVFMMLYSSMISGVLDELKEDEDERTAMILAAMLHHIGMAQIPSELRHKSEELNDTERQQIADAAKLSEKYLRACGVTDIRILSTPAHAREHFDGSGPQGLYGSNIKPNGRITGLLSMFEAQSQHRSYRSRLLPRDAIRKLVKEFKSWFDPIYLKALIEAVSLYPVGSYVQLNSGDIGQVIRVYPRLPLRPKVLLLRNRNGDTISPREVDLQQQPNLMVQRCMYETDISALLEKQQAS